MCLCAQNSIRGSRQRSTLWFALWNLLDEWLMPPGKCPRFTITKTMALDPEHRSLGVHTDRSSGCCFLMNPKCWLPIHATSPKHTDAYKGNSPLTWGRKKKKKTMSSFTVHCPHFFHCKETRNIFIFYVSTMTTCSHICYNLGLLGLKEVH